MTKSNEKIIEFCKNHANKDIITIKADKDTYFIDTIDIDVSNLKPQIAFPPSPDNIVDVKSIDEKTIDSVSVGSCTNKCIEDIRIVAKIFENKKVHKKVMFKIVPAIKEVYGQMIKEGLIEKLYNSGGIIANPGCGGGANEQIGMIEPGAFQLSTSNRNFTGKQGTLSHLLQRHVQHYSE